MVFVDPAGSHDHPSRDTGALASSRLLPILALEVTISGRPAADRDGAARIRQMSMKNPLWGVPCIHGELLKLGFEIAQSSVARYMVKRRGPPCQGWLTFLRNHAPDIVAMDLFVVPTIGFDLLYAFVVVRLNRRDLQNGFAERLIGSIRRECLGHVIVLGEPHLRRILKSYADYYNSVRNASVFAQGCADFSSDSSDRNHSFTPDPRRASPSLRPSLSFRVQTGGLSAEPEVASRNREGCPRAKRYQDRQLELKPCRPKERNDDRPQDRNT